MLKIRFDFIGKQNGETVSGHYFTSEGETGIGKWLNEQKIYPHIFGEAGLVPEDFILPWEMVDLIVDLFPRSKWALALALFNKVQYEIYGNFPWWEETEDSKITHNTL